MYSYQSALSAGSRRYVVQPQKNKVFLLTSFLHLQTIIIYESQHHGTTVAQQGQTKKAYESAFC